MREKIREAKMNNMLANEKAKKILSNKNYARKIKYPGHMKLMQDLKSIRAKIEVKFERSS